MHLIYLARFLTVILCIIGGFHLNGNGKAGLELLEATDSPLMQASRQGNLTLAVHLINNGANIDELNDCGETAFSIANSSNKKSAKDIQEVIVARGPRKHDVRSLLRQGQIKIIEMKFKLSNLSRCIYEYNTGGYSSYDRFETLLSLAAALNATDFMKSLLEHGASVDIADQSGDRALIRAAKANNSEAIKVLLEAKADPSSPNFHCDTPLSLVSRHGNLRAVQMLLARRAKVDIPSPMCASALSGAIEIGNLEIVKLLTAAGATHRKSLHNFEGHYTSSLRLAKELSQQKVIWVKQYDSYLLQSTGTTKAELHERYEIERTVFLAAQKYLDQRFLNIMNGDMKIDHQDEAGLTLLMESAIDGMPTILSKLLSSGAAMEVQDRRGMTALGHAVVANEEACVKILIQSGANVNHISKRLGETPLLLAVHGRNPEIVKLLLEAKANSEIPDAEGKTALRIAEEDMRDLQKGPEIESVLNWRNRTQRILELFKSNRDFR